MARSETPKVKSSPTSKQPVIKSDPDYYMKRNPSWRFNQLDSEGPWKIDIKDTDTVLKILNSLKSFETQTWQQILSQSNNKHHNELVSSLNKIAIDRLAELKIYEDRILSLRLSGNVRIYGILYGSALNILWYDTNHGNNDTCVCRSNLKHT